MSHLSRRVRVGVIAGVVATAATLAAVVPTGGASAAAARSQTVHHATVQSVVAQLPNYFPGVVHWKVSTSWRHYGTTNWDTNTITISAFTPLNLLYSVIAHEWSHEIQAYDYHREFWRIVTSMNRHFGGPGTSGQRGIEYSADCMAVVLGATWTDYTSCHNKKWRHAAKRLLAGHELKARHKHHKKSSGTTAYTTPTSTTTPDPDPTPTSIPQPDPYPAPPQYTITWTGW